MLFWLSSNTDTLKLLNLNREFHIFLMEDGNYADKVLPYGLIYVGY